MTCLDCVAKPVGFNGRCNYHDLIAGGHNDSPMRQALAISIDPEAFTKIGDSFVYFSLNGPGRERKFGPWEERAIWAAFAAADRVAVLVGWGSIV